MMKRFLILMGYLIIAIMPNIVFAQQHDKNKKDSVEELRAIKVYVPRPKFDVGSVFTGEELWRWDDKDPRYYSSFLNKIFESLEKGPF